MAEFFLRPKARQDLEDIWNYTYDNWGEAQADSYIYDTGVAFQTLADKPERGRSCDDIREGYRMHYIGKHIIFYRATKKGIEIVRILHQRMDPNQHF